jgi:protein-tyrosine-phosphatase/predicted ATP-grasp superfamily ATP-dependent carboligase
MKYKALVLGEDTRSFLSVIRSLGRQNYSVDVVCYNQRSPTLASQYIHQAYFYNYQAYSQEEWLDKLLELTHQQKYDVIMPCDERAIYPLYEHRHRFPDTCHLGIPNRQVIEHLFDKETTKQLAIKCAVPVAKGELVKLGSSNYQQLATQFAVPFVVKPTLSFKSAQLSKRQKVEIIESPAQYQRYLDQGNGQDVVLIEEYFAGTGQGISLFAVQGQVQYFFAHTRVNEPRTGGGSSYRKAISVDPEMAKACERLCVATQFDGVGMFEFKKNEQTKRWILIEVNARFWGSLPLAIKAGVDFPAYYAQYLLKNFVLQASPVLDYNLKVYARSLSSDLYDIKAQFEFVNGHVGFGKAMWEMIKRFGSFSRLLRHESLDSYDAQDSQPFYQECKQFYGDTIGQKIALKRGKPKSAQMDKLMALLYSLGDHITIHFVCYGNIMRSPMAEHYLQILCAEVGLNWHISSSGFHQAEHRDSPQVCQKVARTMGVNLLEHRSTWLKQRHIAKKTHIIFVFDRHNTIGFKEAYQGQHVFNLAHFIPPGLGVHQAIDDPYGKGEPAVQRCYLLIAEAVKNIFEQYRVLARYE